MAKIIFVTGGSRSGKSDYAQKMAEALPGPRAYLATCPIIDEEMAERCRKHQEARARADWDTIEEERDIAGILNADEKHKVILVDCLTLWVNNLIYEAEQNGRMMTEEDIIGKMSGFACRLCNVYRYDHLCNERSRYGSCTGQSPREEFSRYRRTMQSTNRCVGR